MSSPLDPAFDFTARDYQSTREALIRLVQTRSPEDWKTFESADVAMVILDLVAWAHANRAFYYNRLALNTYMASVDQRDAAVALAQQAGYQPRPRTAASVPITLAPIPPQPVPIRVPAGTRVSVNGLTYEALDDITIPARIPMYPDGLQDDNPVLTEGETITDSFVSGGLSFQEFVLSRAGLIGGTLEVTIDGEVWREVPSLLFVEGTAIGRDEFDGDGTDGQTFDLTDLFANIDPEHRQHAVVLVNGVVWAQVAVFSGGVREFMLSQTAQGITTVTFGAVSAGAAPPDQSVVEVLYHLVGTQKRYSLSIDHNDVVTLRFGDGASGLIPPLNASISAVYRVGSGVLGNIARGALIAQISGVLPNGRLTTVNVTNREPGRGGEDRESIDHIKVYAPAFAKSNERAVTTEDYDAIAATYRDARYGAPSHAKARLKQEKPELNTVVVSVWSRDETGAIAAPSSGLKEGIRQALISKSEPTVVIEMEDGETVYLDAELAVDVATGYDNVTVFAAVETAVRAFFRSAAYVRPGFDFSVSRFYDLIQSVEGVERLQIVSISGAIATVLDLPDGDGTATLLEGNFVLPEGQGIVPGSVRFSAGTASITDDGEGGLVGDVAATGSIDYATGIFSVDWATAPTVGTLINGEARYIAAFDQIEDLGVANGTQFNARGVTKFSPIIQRPPRGVIAANVVRCINDLRVGTSFTYRGRVPSGIIPGSITVIRGDKTITDSDNGDGTGTFIGDVAAVSLVDYRTGEFALTFDPPSDIVLLPVLMSYTSRTVDFVVEGYDLPLVPGRLFFIGGYDPAGAELRAYDDGKGNIVGDVDFTQDHYVDYASGRVRFSWNTFPAPGSAPTAIGWAVFDAAASAENAAFVAGTGRTGTFVIRDAASPAGAVVTLPATHLGRLKIEGSREFSGGSTTAFAPVHQDAFDNWQGLLHGETLDREGLNTLDYDASEGRITLVEAPKAAGLPWFAVPVTLAGQTVFFYSAFRYSADIPNGDGYEAYLFADNLGELWGTNANTFPTDRLDHEVGRYVAELVTAPVLGGAIEVSYDAEMRTQGRDLTVSSDRVASPGQTTITEQG